MQLRQSFKELTAGGSLLTAAVPTAGQQVALKGDLDSASPFFYRHVQAMSSMVPYHYRAQILFHGQARAHEKCQAWNDMLGFALSHNLNNRCKIGGEELKPSQLGGYQIVPGEGKDLHRALKEV